MAKKNAMGVIQRGQLVANVLRLADMIRLRFKPGKTRLQEVAFLIMTETECSHATSYRWAGEFVDALGLELEKDSADRREQIQRKRVIHSVVRPEGYCSRARQGVKR